MNYKNFIENYEYVAKCVRDINNKSGRDIKILQDRLDEFRTQIRETISSLESQIVKACRANAQEIKKIEEENDAVIEGLNWKDFYFKKEEMIKFFDIERNKERELKLPILNEKCEKSVLHGKIVESKNNKYRIVVLENQKPVNKYSVVIYGDSIFPQISENIKFNQYGIGIHLNGGAFPKINFKVRDFKTLEEARAFVDSRIERNKKYKEFKTYLEKLDKNYDDFLKVVLKSNYCKKIYLQYMKRYYENNVSDGRASEEYADVIRELKTINSED